MLTEERLTELFRYSFGLIDSRMTPNQQAFCRAIESAATAPLLARIAELEKECDRLETYWNKCLADCKNIAELERQLEEARKDAMNAAALICDALPAPPSCNVLERNLWDVATVAAADAIRAAIKEQT